MSKMKKSKHTRLTDTKWCRKCGGSGVFNSAECDLCKGNGKARIATCLGLGCDRKFAMRHRFDKICPYCSPRLSETKHKDYKVILGR